MADAIRDLQKESSEVIVRDIKREATVRDILPLHHLFQSPYKTVQALKELTKVCFLWCFPLTSDLIYTLS